jgi:predicted Zn-dependent peptidase
VVKVSVSDLKRVATQYLKPEKASIAVVTHAGNKELMQELGLTIKTL